MVCEGKTIYHKPSYFSYSFLSLTKGQHHSLVKKRQPDPRLKEHTSQAGKA